MLQVESTFRDRARDQRSGRPLRLPLRFLLTLLAPLAVLLLAGHADAYPWMIRHDYTVCSTCHVDPSGAGLMTQYGRAQSEVLLRTRYGSPPPDEDPTKLGGFLFGIVPLPGEVLLQGDARGAMLRVQPPGTAPAVLQPILMQADLAAGAVVDRFRASVSLGYAHDGAPEAAVTHGDSDRLVSRQHWAGVVFGDGDAFMLRAGRMNLPYGLRVIEHTLWIKSETGTDVNTGQQHGLALSYAPEGWRMEVMGIIGNLQLSPPELRQHGYAAYVERSFAQRAAIGLSSMITHASYDLTEKKPMFRQAHGLFARFLPMKPLVIMTEGDVLVRSPRGAPFTLGATGMIQLDVEPVQGLHLVGTGEVLDESFATQSPSFGGWLSLHWFVLPHVDLRFDFTRRDEPTPSGRADTTTLLGQIHVFL